MALIIIPGEPEPEPRPYTPFSPVLFKHQIEKVLKNTLRLEQLRKIQELRKSCGVVASSGTVSVRIPFQYVKDC